MRSTPLTIEQTFQAPVEMVWNAITDADAMKHWYFDIPEFIAEPGFTFSFTGEDEYQQYVHHCRVIAAVPQRRLSHTWQYEGQDEQTLVTFELFPGENSTVLRLTHEGLEKITHHGPAFNSSKFAEGWKMIIGTSLKNYLENKTG